MSNALAVVQTERLVIRSFVPDDLHEIHHVLSEAWAVPASEREVQLAERERWLLWTIASYEQLAALGQPAYGERAIVLRSSGHLIGAVGLVPSLGPFRSIAHFPDYDGSERWYPEVGLFWAIAPAHQRKGYATEAAAGLIEQAMMHLNLARIVATTEFSNHASMQVMRKLGMRLLRNQSREPEWLQVVGVLERGQE